ncbi:MAG TPA: Crp/Fnr family transcriptional regulator [Candidatus Acidoferrales bacterium]|nr:Crp/Fnr family transcriptional regulator [Candidatus Acidoferrales bacterium]
MNERSISGFRIVPRGNNGTMQERHVMRAPYGLDIIESCLRCPHREERLFCNLPPAAVQRLASITSPSTHAKGATLFVEGQSPRGVYILCSGRVKLSTTSADGKTLIVRMSEPGEVLGLPATVTGSPYELTADVVEPTQVNFIPRNEFLNFLRDHGEAALRVAQQLGETYHSAVSEMRTIGLSHSASEKLARFLLDWCASNSGGKDRDEIRAHMTLTHEEIAQVIGASRETVTRLFSDFKKRQLLQVKGSTLIIPSKAALEHLLNSPS